MCSVIFLFLLTYNECPQTLTRSFSDGFLYLVVLQRGQPCSSISSFTLVHSSAFVFSAKCFPEKIRIVCLLGLILTHFNHECVPTLDFPYINYLNEHNVNINKYLFFGSQSVKFIVKIFFVFGVMEVHLGVYFRFKYMCITFTLIMMCLENCIEI